MTPHKPAPLRAPWQNFAPFFSLLNSAYINTPPHNENTQQSIRNFQRFTEQWNQSRSGEHPVALHYINLDLNDLPDGALKKRVLNIDTTFYLPEADIRDLRQSAKILLEQNETWRNLPGRNGNWRAIAP